MIGIVDYGMGNLGSIANMLDRIELDNVVTSDPVVLSEADRLILPGVGAFDRGIESLHELGLVTVLEDLVLGRRVPLLGICLGMELLAGSSEEGEQPGLGWIDASVERFRFEPGSDLKVPHMGWNEIEQRRDIGLLDPQTTARFYFVHSYYFVCNDDQAVWCTSRHGIEFTSAVAKDNLIGVQFHPEKSHRFGLSLLRAFGSFAAVEV
jgi:glutamine amidotransferase